MWALLGYVVGAILRTIFDYCWKIIKDPTIKFDAKYWATMVISIILSFISALVTFTAIEIPVGATSYVILSSITQGFAMNDIVNKPVDYLSSLRA